MLWGLLTTLAGVGAILLGGRQLRPRPAEMEEFVTGRSPRNRPILVEAAGPILGIVGVVAGILLVAGGLLYLLLGLT
ncbi:MAG: hypothetical protein HY658_14895 [Actinobacteria bacterium]|nr:hypothetical protein [Actinomycetota bacterium]